MNHQTPALRRSFFLLLLAGVSVAFVWVLAPFFGAVLWAITLALLFHPLNRWLLVRLRGRASTAALLTLLLCVLIVIVPVAAIATSIAGDILAFIQNVRGGQINFHDYYEKVIALLPLRVLGWLDQFELFNPEKLLEKISAGLLEGGQLIARHTLEVGQNTFQFLVNFSVMLYLLFFLLRDGTALARLVGRSIPLPPEHTRFLLGKFATVVRATVKGNVLIAAAQGLLGGLAFAVLGLSGALFWGVVMALLSLLPAIGAALVWVPAAIYLFATHAVWQGVALTLWGVLVIGMSDNLLRPMLVGKDTKLPDWLVLLSTLGGMALFGINGFVIGPTIAALFVACWAVFNRQSDLQRNDTEAD